MLSKIQYLAVLSAFITQSASWFIYNSPPSNGIACVTPQENSNWYLSPLQVPIAQLTPGHPRTADQINQALQGVDEYTALGTQDYGGQTWAGSGSQNINPLPPPAAVILDPICTTPPTAWHHIYQKIGNDVIIFEVLDRSHLAYCAVVTNSDTQGQGWHQCNEAPAPPTPATAKERRGRIQKME